jgi:ACS family hexuronate transporter-like MFS transporter
LSPALTPAASRRLRWFAACVLFTSSTLNYLDRATVNALAPTILKEFSLNREQFGYVLSAFNIVYALSAPIMGWWIDRLGLRLGAALAVGLWSLAGMSTALVSTFGQLLFARGALGFAEAGGIPSTAKASAVYLEPKDRALGGAVSQLGLSIGIILAPVLTSTIATTYGWRWSFLIFGLLGFVWIPIWWLVARRIPERHDPTPVRVSNTEILRDRRFLTLIAANLLAMTTYSLWTNWNTLFFVTQYKLTQEQANLHFAWISPIFGSAGGLVGGWFAQRLMHRTDAIIPTRMKIAFWGALAASATALAPQSPTPAGAVVAISISFFATTAMSVNYYSLPLDLYGPARTGFAVSFLTSAYGIMQVFLSPMIGRWGERYGWEPVCATIAILPLASWFLLRTALKSK